MNYEKSCGAIVYKDDCILLITQIQGHTCFPKGHIEGCETEQECAIREILEETSIQVSISDSFRYVLTYSPYPNIKKDVIYFLAKYISGTPKPQLSEVSSIQWVKKEQVENLLTYKSDKQLWKQAQKYLK